MSSNYYEHFSIYSPKIRNHMETNKLHYIYIRFAIRGQLHDRNSKLTGPRHEELQKRLVGLHWSVDKWHC